MRTTILGLALALGAAPAAAGQADITSRLAGRLAPDVVAAVARIADSATARHLPIDLIVEKASEGAVKGVPRGPLVAAASTVLHQLDEAATAIRAAGSVPEPEAIEAGAVAINAGLGPPDVQTVVRRTRPPYTPAATLRVAATLAALGVPGPQAVELVERAMYTHQTGEGLLDLPREVEADMANGASASDAATHVGHGASTEPATASPHGSSNPAHSHKP